MTQTYPPLQPRLAELTRSGTPRDGNAGGALQPPTFSGVYPFAE